MTVDELRRQLEGMAGDSPVIMSVHYGRSRLDECVNFYKILKVVEGDNFSCPTVYLQTEIT